MKEFSNIISVYPLSELTNEIPAPWITDIVGSHCFYADDFFFEPSQSDSESGVLFNCDKTITIDKPSPADVALFSYPVNAIAVLKDTAGIKYPIGTKTLPATVMIQNNIQKALLIIKASAVSSPI